MFNRFIQAARTGASVVLAAVAPMASAVPITYVYTGHDFDTSVSGAPVTRLQMAFTVDDSMVSVNASVQLASNYPGNIVDFVFSDGNQMLTGDPNSDYGVYTTATLKFETDANRNIVGTWDVAASRAHGGPGGLLLDDAMRAANYLTYPGTGLPLAQDSTHSLGRYSATLDNSPGTWVLMSAVPEPAAWSLFVAGAALLAPRAWSRRSPKFDCGCG